MAKFKAMSVQAERDLLVRAQGGDRSARNELVMKNQGLIGDIARRYRSCGIDRGDLMGYGNIGMLTAIDRFDLGLSQRFVTYASQWVREAMSKAMRDQSLLIRIPACAWGVNSKFRAEEMRMYRQTGREPEFDEVAQSLGWPDSRVEVVRKARGSRAVLRESEHTSTRDGDKWTMDRLVDRPHESDLDADALDRELADLGRMVRELPATQRLAVEMAYYQGVTDKVIGAAMGRTATTARYHRREGEAKLRARIEEQRAIAAQKQLL